MKIVTVIGARPQFIKAASVSRLLRRQHTEIFIHTGQHYDRNLSTVFFEELDIPLPDYNLGVGSGPHGLQTGTMLARIEEVLLEELPDCVIVYGDTNSTIAGALAAVKLHIPVAHVEAGLRSNNRKMPEEINRVLTDHISSYLFCPSQSAVQNLETEGIVNGVYLVGDVMYDSLMFAIEKVNNCSRILDQLGIHKTKYFLATIHRAENTNNPERLKNILEAFSFIDKPIVFPIHPRTRKVLEGIIDINFSSSLIIIDPVGYLDMAQLISSAEMILTDSGGIQKEAYWLGIPCVTLREETEWNETVDWGWNILVGDDPMKLLGVINNWVAPHNHPPLYAHGKASLRISQIINEIINPTFHSKNFR